MFLVLSAKIKTFFELLIFLLSFSSDLMNSSFTFRNFTFSSSFARSSSKGLRSATCGALCLVLKPYVFVGCVLVLLSFPCRKKCICAFHRIRWIKLFVLVIRFFR